MVNNMFHLKLISIHWHRPRNENGYVLQNLTKISFVSNLLDFAKKQLIDSDR